jgi:hypothetical protein
MQGTVSCDYRGTRYYAGANKHADGWKPEVRIKGDSENMTWGPGELYSTMEDARDRARVLGAQAIAKRLGKS